MLNDSKEEMLNEASQMKEAASQMKEAMQSEQSDTVQAHRASDGRVWSSQRLKQRLKIITNNHEYQEVPGASATPSATHH
ncbi:hypothetical protein AB6D20_027735 (plasmid) [Vibrio splendidus]